MNDESLSAMLPPELAELRYRPLFVFQIAVKAPSIVGATPGHDRRIGEITGGRFEGERLRGTILSGGSDWQSLRQDGATTLNVRLVMQTDDDQLIAVRYRGVRHGPQEVLARIGLVNAMLKRMTCATSSSVVRAVLIGCELMISQRFCTSAARQNKFAIQ